MKAGVKAEVKGSHSEDTRQFYFLLSNKRPGKLIIRVKYNMHQQMFMNIGLSMSVI